MYLASHPALADLRAWHGEFTRIRQDLHANPELGFEEVRTAGVVSRLLESYGVDEIHTGIGKTGVVGLIHGLGGAGGPLIGLRADMDALPMQEENSFEHRSTTPGRMHGCGHDGHTTMLLAAARYLAKRRNFSGTVCLIFQPGEEGFAGAQAMIDDGLFDRFDCRSVYAMHNWPGLPPGKLAVRPGPMMAAADQVTIEIDGRGGHGAHPYLAIDPVVVAAHIICAAQSIVSRAVPPLQSGVVSLCSIQSGTPAAFSVIPAHALVTGTVRTFSPIVQELIEKRLGEICAGVAAAFGATARLKYQRLYPATINTEAEAEFGAEVARELVGPDNFIGDLEPSMGAEDFSFMLHQRPGAYFRIGQGGAETGCFLHNTRYDFNDAILPLGAALFARLAERALPTT